MKIKTYDIWVADLNPQIGTEPGKVRPVVIIQTNMLNNLHPSTIICPITTNVHERSNILRLHLNKGECSLSRDSDIVIDQLRAIDNRRLIKKTGTLSIDQIKRLKKNIRIILELN